MNTYIKIQAGMGGVEACDWACMVVQMYTKWAERHGHIIDVLTRFPGEEDGVQSATLCIQGAEILKTETGVHRLVRISPFDPQKRRHTSFAIVHVDIPTAEYTMCLTPIRSYIFDPYTLVKDRRTGIETEDVQAVLDGGIDIFIEPEGS